MIIPCFYVVSAKVLSGSERSMDRLLFRSLINRRFVDCNLFKLLLFRSDLFSESCTSAQL